MSRRHALTLGIAAGLAYPHVVRWLQPLRRQARTRVRVAKHALRGRPIMYRMYVGEPWAGRVGKGSEHLLICECHFDGTAAPAWPVPPPVPGPAA